MDQRSNAHANAMGGPTRSSAIVSERKSVECHQHSQFLGCTSIAQGVGKYSGSCSWVSSGRLGGADKTTA